MGSWSPLLWGLGLHVDPAMGHGVCQMLSPCGFTLLSQQLRSLSPLGSPHPPHPPPPLPSHLGYTAYSLKEVLRPRPHLCKQSLGPVSSDPQFEPVCSLSVPLQGAQQSVATSVC